MELPFPQQTNKELTQKWSFTSNKQKDLCFSYLGALHTPLELQPN